MRRLRPWLGGWTCEMLWILFLSVMCSFSCWLVIQSLVVSAPCSMFWSLQSMWIKHMFQIYRRTTLLAGPNAHPAPPADRLFSVAGANPKKPSAPDMFTESDDLFAADFDVSTDQVWSSKINGNEFLTSFVFRAPGWELRVWARTSRRTPTSGTTGPTPRATTVSSDAPNEWS